MAIVRSSRLYLCYYRIWCAMPWLLVVGGQVQGTRLCVRDGGCCSSRTTSIILLPCICRLCVEQHPSSCCPAPAGYVSGMRDVVRVEQHTSSCCPAPDRRPAATKALHTICGNNTSIVWSSWWWAYKCPKHVEQITSAINNSIAFRWAFFYTHGNGSWGFINWVEFLPSQGTISLSKTMLRELLSLIQNVGLYRIDEEQVVRIAR